MKIVRAAAQLLSDAEAHWYGRRQRQYYKDLTFTAAVGQFPERNALHAYAHHYFRHICPEVIRTHRAYFRRDQRGFGEDAFHAMWWILLREFKPERCLEIGVYRGQVISLWAMTAKTLGYSCEVHGISPFLPVGDAVSNYREDVDYLADTLKSFDAFDLPHPTLVCALSIDPSAVKHLSTQKWDLIYIDGSHDYKTVFADYILCRDHLTPGGLLVMDDASLGTPFKPPRFSFAAHPGPSLVAVEFAIKELKFLGAVGHVNVFRSAGASSLTCTQ